MGKYKTQKTNYDLMNVVMIRLGKHDDKTENKLVGMLNVLLSSEIEPQEKKERLSGDYGINLTDTTEGRINEMCNLGEGIYEQGIEKGIEKRLLYTVDKNITHEFLALSEVLNILGRKK